MVARGRGIKSGDVDADSIRYFDSDGQLTPASRANMDAAISAASARGCRAAWNLGRDHALGIHWQMVVSTDPSDPIAVEVRDSKPRTMVRSEVFESQKLHYTIGYLETLAAAAEGRRPLPYEHFFDSTTGHRCEETPATVWLAKCHYRYRDARHLQEERREVARHGTDSDSEQA